MQIRKREGKKSGKTGITIQIIDQAKKQSKALTLHGITVQEAFNQISTWFKILEMDPGGIRIEWQKKK